MPLHQAFKMTERLSELMARLRLNEETQIPDTKDKGSLYKSDWTEDSESTVTDIVIEILKIVSTSDRILNDMLTPTGQT